VTLSGGTNSKPEIETARLRLRSFRASDLERQAAIMADREVVRFLGGHPFSREDSWRRILATPGLWQMLGYGYWAVERRDNGQLIGQIGFADFKRAMTPSIEGIPEMGWIFAPDAQGQGFAGEAAMAALAWGDRHLPGDEIVAIIEPGNAASVRVAERAGFTDSGEARYRDEIILLFRRPIPARGEAKPQEP
jgi:RimJ/RimL family protein N-acetyltransferase